MVELELKPRQSNRRARLPTHSAFLGAPLHPASPSACHGEGSCGTEDAIYRKLGSKERTPKGIYWCTSPKGEDVAASEFQSRILPYGFPFSSITLLGVQLLLGYPLSS